MIAAGENGAAAPVARESTTGLPVDRDIKPPRTARKEPKRGISIVMQFESVQKMQTSTS